MKIAFVLIGSLSLAAARVYSNQLSIQDGINEVNKYLSGSHQADLSGILYLLKNNALLNLDDYNVFLGSVNNQQNARDVANAVLKHLQVDQAIQDIKPYLNSGSVNELINLLNKDLFKQDLLNNQELQALINSLLRQVPLKVVVKAGIKYLHIGQAIQVLKNYELGNTQNTNTLGNVLNNDLLNEGLISHDDYDVLKGQLKGGAGANGVASEAVGLLHKENDVQILLHNVPYDEAIQVLKNYQAQNSGDENALFNILHNDLLKPGLIIQQDYDNLKSGFRAPPINGDLNELAEAAINVLNNKRRVQSD